jgi:hypothetical protein
VDGYARYTDLGRADARDFGEQWTPTMPNLQDPTRPRPSNMDLVFDSHLAETFV